MLRLGVALLSTLVLQVGSDGPTLRRFEAVETHMGTPFQIVLYTADEATASRAFKAAFSRIHQLDLALSDYNPESELMKLCDKAGGPPVKIGDDLFDVLSRALQMSERTNGAFDPTIAPVVRLWRRARREKKLPDPERIAAAKALVGYRKVKLNAAERTAQLEKGVKLDLGGIAKGYASQAAIDVLKSLGVKSALVAGAGDIVASDAPPGKPGWSVGVAPLDNPGKSKSSRFLVLANKAVSTAGDAEQFVEIGGVRYSHIVDPKTGVGQTERTSVTVVAPHGALADALDTSASLLGPELGMKLIQETPGTEAFFVRRLKSGEEVRKETPGFSKLEEKQP